MCIGMTVPASLARRMVFGRFGIASVATVTGHFDMHANQRIASFAVPCCSESRWHESVHCVAFRTLTPVFPGEERPLVVVGMAIDAHLVGDRIPETGVGMAARTNHSSMPTQQWKTRHVMVESSGRLESPPSSRCVTGFAILRKPTGVGIRMTAFAIEGNIS